MRPIILLLPSAVASTLLAGCATGRPLQVVERIQRDTIYIHQVQYDSIHIDQAKYVDRTRDTLLIQDRVVEYRYKLLRDTIRIHQTDTIPVVCEVERVKAVPRPLRWYDKLCRAIAAAAALAVVALVWLRARGKRFHQTDMSGTI